MKCPPRKGGRGREQAGRTGHEPLPSSCPGAGHANRRSDLTGASEGTEFLAGGTDSALLRAAHAAMSLHIDARTPRWFACEQHDLLVVLDDASSTVYYA